MISLADILSETYQKLLRNFGGPPGGTAPVNGTTPVVADPQRQGAQTPGLYGRHALEGTGSPQMFGPLGVITPFPGLTSLWPAGTPPVEEAGEGTLWALASSGPAINVTIHQNSTFSTMKELDGVRAIDGKFKVRFPLSCSVGVADAANRRRSATLRKLYRAC